MIVPEDQTQTPSAKARDDRASRRAERSAASAAPSAVPGSTRQETPYSDISDTDMLEAFRHAAPTPERGGTGHEGPASATSPDPTFLHYTTEAESAHLRGAGARWSVNEGGLYVPAGKLLEPFERHIASGEHAVTEKTYIAVDKEWLKKRQLHSEVNPAMTMVSYDPVAQSYYVRRGTDTARLHPDVAAQLHETVDRGQNRRVFLNVGKESWSKFKDYLAADPERAKDFGRDGGGKPFIKPHRTPNGVEAFLDPPDFTSNEALSINKEYVRGVPKEILAEMNVNLAGKSPHEVAFVEAGKSAAKVAPMLNYPEKMGRPAFRTRSSTR